MNLVLEIEKEIDEKLILEYTNYLNKILNNKKDFSIVIVDNEYIHKLNFEFRQKDYPTDVLTFVEDDENYLGDIIISYDKIISQAKDYNHTFKRELLFLITHGFLHLLGYDHQEEKEEKEMFNLQKKLLIDYGVKK